MEKITAQPLPIPEKQPSSMDDSADTLMSNSLDTLQNSQLKDNSPPSTSFIRRIVRLATKVTVSLVVIPLMSLILSVSNILLYPSILSKAMYASIPINKKVPKYIAAITFIPIEATVLSLLIGIGGIWNGIMDGIKIAKNLSLQPCKDRMTQYKKTIDMIFNQKLHDDQTNLLVNKNPESMNS